MLVFLFTFLSNTLNKNSETIAASSFIYCYFPRIANNNWHLVAAPQTSETHRKLEELLPEVFYEADKKKLNLERST